MFLGQFQHNLDDKGRLMIPARYRDLLAAGAYITQGFDKCLMVMTDAYFKEVYSLINAMNMADPTARMLRRLILSNAYPVEVDKVGRVLVPQNLREFLGIVRQLINVFFTQQLRKRNCRHADSLHFIPSRLIRRFGFE